MRTESSLTRFLIISNYSSTLYFVSYPLVKAGGMRITQSGKTPEKPAAGGDKASKEDDDYVEEPP